jgi:hypothetical protein
MVNHLEADTV